MALNETVAKNILAELNSLSSEDFVESVGSAIITSLSIFEKVDEEEKMTGFDMEKLKLLLDSLNATKKTYKEQADAKIKADKEAKKAAATAAGTEYAKTLNEGDIVRYYKSSDKKYHLAKVIQQKAGAKRLAVIIADSDTDSIKRHLMFSSLDTTYVATDEDRALFDDVALEATA